MEINIKKGVYLVADMRRPLSQLEEPLFEAMQAGICALQLWGTPPPDKGWITQVCRWAQDFEVPVLAYQQPKLLEVYPTLSGIHFDRLPLQGILALRQQIGRPLLVGLTCGNELEYVRQAASMGVDYLSFCAMFPSRSTDSCTLVSPETVQEARTLTPLPLFVSGGITPERIPALLPLGIDGVAVVSGILDAPCAYRATQSYRQQLLFQDHETFPDR